MSNKIKNTVLIETALLKALANRKNYKDYISYVSIEKLLIETQTLLDGYGQYYELYDHEDIQWDTFLTQFCTNWHSQDMVQEDIELYKNAILTLDKAEAKEAETALLGLINRQLLDQIQVVGSKPFTGESIRKLLDEYDRKLSCILKEQDDGGMTSDDVDFESIDKSLGIPYYLDPLQEALGGMVPGSSVVVNAASGIGKSAFLHGQVNFTLRWLKNHGIDRPILWFNTEGPRSEVYGRLWSNIYREQFPAGYREILKNKPRIQKHFKKMGFRDLFRVYTANSLGLNGIRLMVKKYNPSLIILDMAAHIATGEGKNTSDTKLLENFFNGLRKLSSDTCPIISTVQAGAGAKWWDKDLQKYLFKQWPTDDDIYGSKTAVQGSAETIITIGRDNDHPFTRYIQTTKKKALLSAKFTCEIQEKYSSYDLKRDYNTTYSSNTSTEGD